MLDDHATSSDRRDTVAILRRMVAENTDRESSAVEFPSGARERHRSMAQSFRRTDQSSGEGVHRRNQGE